MNHNSSRKFNSVQLTDAQLTTVVLVAAVADAAERGAIRNTATVLAEKTVRADVLAKSIVPTHASERTCTRSTRHQCTSTWLLLFLTRSVWWTEAAVAIFGPAFAVLLTTAVLQ